jgi:hypothetical protein
MRYGHPQQTQIVSRVPIGVGLLAASLTGEVLAPVRPKRAAARATLARMVRLRDLDANAGDVGLVRDACPKLRRNWVGWSADLATRSRSCRKHKSRI